MATVGGCPKGDWRSWRGDDDTQSPCGPCQRKPHAPNQTVPHNPLRQAGEWKKRAEGLGVVRWRRGQLRGLDESLNRTEEGHTGAMAIPKTTYLLSHNDSACQNNCQDTRWARNWLTPARPIGRTKLTPPPSLTYEGSLGPEFHKPAKISLALAFCLQPI